jgi:hypothetical protein
MQVKIITEPYSRRFVIFCKTVLLHGLNTASTFAAALKTVFFTKNKSE